MPEQKKDFYLGLSVGVAAVSFMAFAVMTVAYFQKGESSLTIKDPIEKKVEAKNAPAKNDDQPAAPAAKADLKIRDNDHVRGDKKAAVTIIEFSDIQCPFCSRFHETIKKVMAAYDGRVRWVFRHFPLESIHPYARKAAEAAECAGEQGKFWEYIDQAYENQQSLNESYISKIAGDIGLDAKKFDGCLSEDKYADKVSKDLREGQAAGVRGTPASFINGQLVSGAQPYEEVKKVIDSLK